MPAVRAVPSAIQNLGSAEAAAGDEPIASHRFPSLDSGLSQLILGGDANRRSIIGYLMD